MIFLSKHKVLKLDIPMHYPILFELSKSFKNASHDYLDLFAWKCGSFDDILKQVPSSQSFHDNIEAVITFKNAFQFEQIVVLNRSHDFQFIEERIKPVGIIFYFSFCKHLSSKPFSIIKSQNLVHRCCASLSQNSHGLVKILETRFIYHSGKMFNPQIGEIGKFDAKLNTLTEIVHKLEPLKFSFTETLNFLLSTFLRNIR